MDVRVLAVGIIEVVMKQNIRGWLKWMRLAFPANKNKLENSREKGRGINP